MERSGLYLHIPFCKSKCYYCDFYSVPALGRKSSFVEALVKEIRTETSFLGGERPALRTLYFGGGTPSLLEREDFERIFEAVRTCYDLSRCEEITLEANPDDLNSGYIGMLRTFPFNRISIGVQSFLDGELEGINRRHSARQAVEAVENCSRQGFDNISIDLMFGLPGQTPESFRTSIDTAVQLPVTHLSSYALSWEEGSVLYRKREQGLLVQTADEVLEACYFELIERLKVRGFLQYELSNFARSGFESKHNSSYWSGVPYLGVGPGAHSYNKEVRRMNVRSIDRYLEGLFSGHPERETEVLDAAVKYNDFIITRLRTVRGMCLSELEGLFGTKMLDYCLKNAAKSLKNGFLVAEQDHLRLQQKGYFIADNILSDLLFIED